MAIIGGGLGGLCCAAYLAGLGYEVDLFEQASQVGGKALQRKTRGFTFDGGPTLLTMPFVLDMVSRELGATKISVPKLLPLEETCRYFYPDTTVFHAYSERPKLYEELCGKMTDPPARMSEYLSYCKRIYDLCAELFLFSSFHELDLLLKHRDKIGLFQVPELDFFRHMHGANASFFKDPRLVQYADRFATFNGSDPFRVPATLNIIHHVEALGASVPLDGIGAIPEYLRALAVEKGVRIHTSKKVRRIVLEGKRVAGIEIDEGFLPYRTVVSNVDVSTTYNYLLGKTLNRDAIKYRLMTPSSSAVVWYWGLKLTDESLSVHNVLFPRNYRAEFRDLFNKRRCPVDPTVYIYVSSKYAPSHAPKDHENWYVMVNAPSLHGQDWDEQIAGTRKRAIATIRERLGVDIDQKLVTEEVFTPKDIQDRTGSYGGSIYGISSNNMLSAFLRQGNRSKLFKGLYFCGGSAHPGGGMPLAILSARITAKLIDRNKP